MAAKWSPNLEPETLAFPIKPRRDEAFDSWLSRLTAAHRVSRAQLFRHLEIAPGLSRLDLARGKGGLDPALHAACDAMVERLAWAVEIDPEQINATFLACEAEALLPSAHRHYVCALCCYEAHLAGGPIIVRREWIFRATWLCSLHGLPLTDMRSLPLEDTGRQLQAFLAHAVMRSRRIQWKIKPTSAALARNKTVIDCLMRPSDWVGLAPPYQRYQEQFVANQYHFARERIGMLALAHSPRTKAAHRFERMIATRLAERPLTEGRIETPVRGALRLRTCKLPKPRSKWTCDIFALIATYGTVRQRQEKERELAAEFARYEGLPFPPTAAWPSRSLLDAANLAVPGLA